MPEVRIDQLDETTEVADTDLLMVGNPTTGKLRKINGTNVVTSLGILPRASEAEVIAGTSDGVLVTPAGLAATLPYFDVRRFGAVGDGITDDTAAVQAAIDAANTATGGLVSFPPGTYLTGPLTVGSRTVLQGHAGLSSALKLKASSTGSHISLKAVTTQQVAVRHLYIDGNAADQSVANDGINFTNQTAQISPSVSVSGDAHHAINDVYVVRTKGNGITLVGRGATQITNTFAYYTGGHGVELDSFDQTLTNVVVGVCDGHGFYLWGNGSNNNLTSCKSFLADLDGFHILGTQGNRLTGCIAQGNYTAGFHIAGGKDHIIDSATSMDNNYGSTSPTTGVGFRLSSVAFRNVITGVAYDDQTVHTQVAGLSIATSATGNRIALTVDAATHTGGEAILTATTVRNNSVSLNAAAPASYHVETFASPWTPDLSLGNVHQMTLTGNLTINRPIGDDLEGAILTMVFTQDATGSRTITFGTGFWDKYWTPDPTASAVSAVTYVHSQGNWYLLGGDFITSLNTWTRKQTFSDEVEIDGALNHDGTTAGFMGATPVVRQTVGAAATDAATTMALVNLLRTALVNLGLAET